MTKCQWCGEQHIVDRATAHKLAMCYPLTICFVARVIDQLDGDLDTAKKWLDAWAPLAIYPTPEYYITTVVQGSKPMKPHR